MYNPIASLESQIALLQKNSLDKDIKHGQALRSLRALLEEKDRTNSITIQETKRLHEIVSSCVCENNRLKSELESEKKNMSRCRAKNMLEQESLNAQNQKLKTRLREIEEFTVSNRVLQQSNSELKEKLYTLNKDRGKMVDQMQDMESLNRDLSIQLQLSTAELQGVREELISFRSRLFKKEKEVDVWTKELDETINGMEDIVSIHKAFLVNERRSTDELKEACQQLIDTNYGMAIMGVLKQEPTKDDCLKHISSKDLGMKTSELRLWREKNFKNQQLHSLKRIQEDGESGLKRRLRELERELLVHNPMRIDDNLELKGKLDTLRKKLEDKADQKQAIDSLNQSLSAQLKMTHHELDGVRSELISVKNRLYDKEKELAETINEREAIVSLNQALLAEKRTTTDKLLQACQELTHVKKNYMKRRKS